VSAHSAPVVKRDTESYNPAKSWKLLLLIVPFALVALLVAYRSQVDNKKTTVQVRPTSAADGKVHVVMPISEVEAEAWDGDVAWQPYPGAASYQVAMFREPSDVLWTESTSTDRIRMQTEIFPASLRRLFYVNATVGYKVIARDAAGKVIADSGPHYFYIKLPGLEQMGQ
jgi:hypothetical protein